MTTAALFALVLLVISSVSVVVQSMALRSLGRKPGDITQLPVHRGLRRTATCRVIAALAYVGLALTSLMLHVGSAVLSLAVFAAVQVMWQFNGIADVRLRRRLGRPPPGQHRKSRGVSDGATRACHEPRNAPEDQRVAQSPQPRTFRSRP